VVATQARGAARQLSELAKQLDRLTLTPDQVKALRGALAQHGANARDADWDDLEQTALALLAVNRALGDRSADEATRKLVQRLAYPVGYHTPKQFRAQKEFDADLQELFKQISP
jgi:hypothetical protein